MVPCPITHGMGIRDPSIDAIHINAIDIKGPLPAEDMQPLIPGMPKPLSIRQKLSAFFGNDVLLAAHAKRQAIKHHLKQCAEFPQPYKRLS